MMTKYLLVSLLIGCVGPHKVVEEPKGNPLERTLWQVCITPDNDLILPSDEPPHTPECENPVQIRYSRFPVPLWSVGEGPVPTFLGHFTATWWNTQLGFEMLKYVPGEIPPETEEGIAINLQPAPDYWLYGLARPAYGGEFFNCVANVYRINEVLDNIAVHEVGHCLGLAHDALDETSVMFPRGVPRPFKVTDADRYALRRLYGVR